MTNGINSLSIPGQIAPYCLTPNKKYNFLLNNVSASEKIEWNINGDWNFVTLANTNTPGIMTGVQSAIISANTAACPSVVITDTFYVKPKTPANISGNTCINAGQDTNTYSVPTVASADSYEWQYPQGWQVVGCTTNNTITFNTDGTVGTLKVRAKGCGNSSWRSKQISIAAQKPIIQSAPSCINTHLPTTFNITVAPVAGETYKWMIPAEFSLLSTNAAKSSITVATTTIAPINTSIKVIAQTQCGTSDTTSIPLNNSGDAISVMFYAAMPPFIPKNFHFINGYEGYSISANLLINDVAYPDSVQVNNGNSVELKTVYQGDIALQPGWLLVLDCEKDGCTNRIIYGDTNYYSYEGVNQLIGLPTKSATLKAASVSSKDARPNRLKLSPNPASDIVVMELANKTMAEKTVMAYDLKGKSMFKKTLRANKLKINTQSWNPGSYIMIVKIGDKVYKEILVKK